MPYPRKHPDSLTRIRTAGAAFRARKRALSPLERLADTAGEPAPYTAEELADLDRLKEILRDAEAVASRLNASLRGRGLGEPYRTELERTTRISLPSF